MPVVTACCASEAHLLRPRRSEFWWGARQRDADLPILAADLLRELHEVHRSGRRLATAEGERHAAASAAFIARARHVCGRVGLAWGKGAREGVDEGAHGADGLARARGHNVRLHSEQLLPYRQEAVIAPDLWKTRAPSQVAAVGWGGGRARGRWWQGRASTASSPPLE